MEELHMIGKNGTRVRIHYSEKWKEWLVRFTFKDGGMHLMFVKDVEEEVEMLKSEGYAESSTDSQPS